MWLICLILGSSERCFCWFSCWIYLTVGRIYCPYSMTSWEDMVSVFVSVIWSPWSENRGCLYNMPPFFCDVNWPLKDLFKQWHSMWKVGVWLNTHECLVVCGVNEKLFCICVRMYVCVNAAMSPCAPVCVCMLINPACCLEGGISLFLLTHILESCSHLHISGVFFCLFSLFSPGGGRSDIPVGLRGPLSVIQ